LPGGIDILSMQIKAQIQDWATELGFQQVGFARAGFLEEEAPLLEKWLKAGYHGEMKYMENWFDKRLDPRLLVEGARTVIVLTFNYHNPAQQAAGAPKISQYAFGEDYHEVIRERLQMLLARMREKYGDVQGRGFVDSAPVLERAWARKAGLGWTGKHTLLISKQKGSYFFLATLITDLEVEEDVPFSTDHCGTCTRCMDVCPTGAIIAPNLVEAQKCISYLTIELKEAIPDSFAGKMDNWAFGCDACQEVCPWNRFSIAHTEEKFRPADELLDMDEKDWQHLTEESFRRLFRKSPVKRTKYTGLMRNIRFLSQEIPQPSS